MGWSGIEIIPPISTHAHYSLKYCWSALVFAFEAMVKAHTSYVLIYGKNNDENEGYSSTWHRAHVRYVAELQIAIRIRLIEKNRQCSTRKYVMQSLISM